MVYFDLTPEQKKLFNKLKATYKACKKAGIFFVNSYGTLEAYNSSVIEGYSDKSKYNEIDDDVISSYDSCCSNTLKFVNEWTDDEHLLKLTPKGKKLLDTGDL
jgi:hypothetical protein